MKDLSKKSYSYIWFKLIVAESLREQLQKEKGKPRIIKIIYIGNTNIHTAYHDSTVENAQFEIKRPQYILSSFH